MTTLAKWSCSRIHGWCSFSRIGDSKPCVTVDQPCREAYSRCLSRFKLLTLAWCGDLKKESRFRPDEIGNLIEEVVDLARQINSDVESDDVQEVLDSPNPGLTIDELIGMHEYKQDIEELVSVDPVQSEDRMTVGYLKGLAL
ncbi:hypothetical protein TNCV_3217521 [Trichonephila clavipes]|nr:hypothetical protein TNCV_3217521 [Trichonephila clavipes]